MKSARMVPITPAMLRRALRRACDLALAVADEDMFCDEEERRDFNDDVSRLRKFASARRKLQGNGP